MDDDIPDLIDTASSNASAGPSRSDVRDSYERRKVPLTILTGYLGAGKSTLLDYVLKEQHGYKIAVCMNDFGDSTDIEAKSLTLTDPTTGLQTNEFLSLPNGCLCCSFKDMGIAAIEEMAHSQGVEWVMVELTGLADPGRLESASGQSYTALSLYLQDWTAHALDIPFTSCPIIRGFWENEEMGDLILDGVVCVVDCRNVLKQLAESRDDGQVNEAQKQVACADVILLNKVDLVDNDTLKKVEESINNINPTLRIYRTTHSRIPLEGMFDLRAYTSAPLPRDTSLLESQRPDKHTHHDEHEPPHSGSITTITIPLPSLTDWQYQRLNTFLEDTLWTMGKDPGPVDISRTKGLIRLVDGREYVLQGVTDVFELKQVLSEGDKGVEEGGKIVFIGKGVHDSLRQDLIKAIDR